MLELRIGSGSEYILLRLPRKGFADGWHHGDVQIAVQCFTGNLSAFFEPADFVRFEHETRSLYDTLSGSAELHPIEGQVIVSLIGNGRGGITVKGEAWSQALWQNKLEFTFEIDQTFLVETLSQLQTIIGQYSKTSVLQQTERPVSGNSNG